MGRSPIRTPTWLSILSLVFATSPLSTEAFAASNWAIGQEREVDEGYYLKLLKTQNGWQLWRIESKSEVECRAVKSAIGRPHPVPIGATVGFGTGEPFIVLYWSSHSHSVNHFWEGPNFENTRVEVRRIGQKFWDQERKDAAYRDGDRLEVNIVSWEYPEIRVGYDETRGVFDLAGLEAMRTEVASCFRAKD